MLYTILKELIKYVLKKEAELFLMKYFYINMLSYLCVGSHMSRREDEAEQEALILSSVSSCWLVPHCSE